MAKYNDNMYNYDSNTMVSMNQSSFNISSSIQYTILDEINYNNSTFDDSYEFQFDTIVNTSNYWLMINEQYIDVNAVLSTLHDNHVNVTNLSMVDCVTMMSNNNNYNDVEYSNFNIIIESCTTLTNDTSDTNSDNDFNTTTQNELECDCKSNQDSGSWENLIVVNFILVGFICCLCCVLSCCWLKKHGINYNSNIINLKKDKNGEINDGNEGEITNGSNDNGNNGKTTNKREKQWTEHFGLEMELRQESPKSPSQEAAYSPNFENGANRQRKRTIDDSVHYE